jgi:predicted nucleic acid-binding protein
MAIILNEPHKEIVIKLTKGSILFAPAVISYEIGNALVNLFKRRALKEPEAIAAYSSFTRIPLTPLDVDMKKALGISCKYNIYAYDAYYLETAERMKLPLITFDASMINTALDMNISILTEELK